MLSLSISLQCLFMIPVLIRSSKPLWTVIVTLAVFCGCLFYLYLFYAWYWRCRYEYAILAENADMSHMKAGMEAQSTSRSPSSNFVVTSSSSSTDTNTNFAWTPGAATPSSTTGHFFLWKRKRSCAPSGTTSSSWDGPETTYKTSAPSSNDS